MNAQLVHTFSQSEDAGRDLRWEARPLNVQQGAQPNLTKPYVPLKRLYRRGWPLSVRRAPSAHRS